MVFNEEDLLRLINRLLERLHQADGEKNSSHITLNYIAPGAQYVNHIDTQVFDSAKLQKPPQDNHINQNTTKLPDCLAIKDKWRTFEKLWHRNNMHSDYNTALSQHQSLEFNEKLKKL